PGPHSGRALDALGEPAPRGPGGRRRRVLRLGRDRVRDAAPPRARGARRAALPRLVERVGDARPAPRQRMIQGEWQPAGPFLDTASYGLPPRRAWDALQAALEEWRCGRTSWEVWAPWTERAREAWAQLVGVPTASVACGATV